jgi:hypothetical protein
VETLVKGRVPTLHGSVCSHCAVLWTMALADIAEPSSRSPLHVGLRCVPLSCQYLLTDGIIVVLMRERRAVPSHLGGADCGDGGPDKIQGNLTSFDWASRRLVSLRHIRSDDNSKNADLGPRRKRKA